MTKELESLPDSLTGYGLWRMKEPHGGYSYWTDEGGCGHMFFDEELSNPVMIFEVLDREGSLDMWLAAYYKSKEP